jgi:hypothetical protein
MEILRILVSKVTSGRFLLTLVCAVVFLYASTHKILEAAAIATILVQVFTNYFDKEKGDKSGKPDIVDKTPNPQPPVK